MSLCRLFEEQVIMSMPTNLTHLTSWCYGYVMLWTTTQTPNLSSSGKVSKPQMSHQLTRQRQSQNPKVQRAQWQRTHQTMRIKKMYPLKFYSISWCFISCCNIYVIFLIFAGIFIGTFSCFLILALALNSVSDINSLFF